MSMGQIYVDVTAAQAESGIMTMAGSSGSHDTGGAWLYWTDAGFTGTSWYWDDSNNEVKAGWEKAVAEEGGYVNSCNGEADGSPHDGSYESFVYHVSQRHSENLNYILGDWDTRRKMVFILTHEALETNGCVQWQD